MSAKRGNIDPAITDALDRLRVAERDRLGAIEELVSLGFVRSRGFVGELGEVYAAAYYGATIEQASNPGFDLIDRDGRKVQVKTLRCTPANLRASMGRMADPYDVLFAIRLDPEYVPIGAIEVPRAVLERHYPHGERTTWTKRLERDEGVKRIGREELLELSGLG